MSRIQRASVRKDGRTREALIDVASLDVLDYESPQQLNACHRSGERIVLQFEGPNACEQFVEAWRMENERRSL
jgi:hypothetical protein